MSDANAEACFEFNQFPDPPANRVTES